MTRDELVADVRHVADADNTTRWPSTRILNALDLVLRREWRGILNANRYYRIGQRAVVSSGTGVIQKSALNAGTGDTVETLYRILAVSVGTIIYKEVQQMDLPLLPQQMGLEWGMNTWFPSGDTIQVVPAEARTVDVIVNHMPQLPSYLSSGSVAIVFPLGYEQVLSYEAGAMLLMKGGTETEAASSLKSMAEEMRRDMLSDIARVSTNPIQVAYPDSVGEWSA